MHSRVMPTRRRWPALLVVALLLVVGMAATSAAQSDRGAYAIRSFDTELTVEPDSNMVVEERIEVQFSEPRHGIFRSIPTRYSDPRGYSYSLGLRLLGVTDDQGRPYRADVSHEGRYTKIRIGDPDSTVNGRVVYVIRYRVREALGQFAEHDEIYWNATGNEWNSAIDRSSATVRLPAPLASADLTTAGYTGAFGRTERDVEISHPEPGVVRFATTRPLEPLEGLTVAVGFPQGVVTFPTAAVRASRIAVDNWVGLLPIGWLLFLIRRYRAHGRDPEPDASVVVAYEPPPGLTPGEVGTLIDEKVDAGDITSTVVDLAVRRHLTIRTESEQWLLGLLEHEETTFTLESGGQGTLTAHEAAVIRGLFGGRTSVRASDLKNKFYTHIPGIKRALYDRLVTDGYFDSAPDRTRTRWVLVGILAGAATSVAAAAWMSLRDVAVPASIVVPLVSGLATWGLFMGFAPAMPRRTTKGARARQWALGFQEFAKRVDGDRLDRATADPRHAFEVLLPYAMALGVATEWARRFEGIYDQRGPEWYAGPHVAGAFSTRSFERTLSGAMTEAGRSMAASPRSSSGSGGGGSSGGGGGGGGGGSW